VEFAGPTDSTRAATDSTAPRVDSPAALAPPPQDSVKRSQGFTVSFAALLVPERARELASQIKVGNEQARVITAMRDGSAIFRVVLGPYPTREEAERVGRESKQSYWVYEGGP
jgi:cell division septation protein DedD